MVNVILLAVGVIIGIVVSSAFIAIAVAMTVARGLNW